MSTYGEKKASDHGVVTEVVLSDNVSLDEEHKNPGGAPVEDVSPIGQEVGWWTALLLNFSQMIGTGIFSTPGTILRQTGSFGLAMIFWVLGGLLGAAGLSYYLEFASLFPNRAGSDVAYLEQCYKRPRFLWPISFAVITVILGFASSNAIVCAEYILYSRGFTSSTYDPWTMRGIAIAAYAIACIIVVINNRFALWVSNVLSAVKILILLFIVVAGWVVLGGGTRVKDSHSHFKGGFSGSSNDGNALAGAMINVIFAYTGWNNAFNVANEVKNPVRTIKTSGTAALLVVFLLYFFANIAYIAAVPVEEAKKSGTLLAAKFFTAVFGQYAGTRVLPVFVALSAFGNLISVAVGQSRVFREVARQGIFPFSKFFASTKPFGTPAAPMLLKFVLTSIIIIGPPAGDAFNLIVSIQTYPNRLFDLAMVVGLYLLRRRRRLAGLSRAPFEAWHIALVFSILVNVFILIMPWVPPVTKTTKYPYWVPWVTGIGILIVCFGYWFLWQVVLPKLGGYTIYEEVTQLSRGELKKQFVKVYNDHRGDEIRRRLQAAESAREHHADYAGEAGSEDDKIRTV